eukprot:gene680-8181_t
MTVFGKQQSINNILVAAGYFSGAISQRDYEMSELSNIVYNSNTIRTSVVGIYEKSGTKEIAVVFRGTVSSTNDLATNLNIQGLYYKNFGSIHLGFWNDYSSVKEEISNFLKQQKYDTYSKYVSGHSQGGAISLMAVLDLKISYSISTICVTFGSPRAIYSDMKMKYLAEIPDSINIRYVGSYSQGNYIEIVPTLPPVYFGYVHVGEERRIRCPDTSTFAKKNCHGIVNYMNSIIRYRNLGTIINNPFKFVSIPSNMKIKRSEVLNIDWEGIICANCELKVYESVTGTDPQIGNTLVVSSNMLSVDFVFPSNAPEGTYYVCADPGTFSCGRTLNNFEIIDGIVKEFDVITPISWYNSFPGVIRWEGVFSASQTFVLYRTVDFAPDVEISRWTITSEESTIGSKKMTFPTATKSCRYKMHVNPGTFYSEYETNEFCINDSLSTLSVVYPTENLIIHPQDFKKIELSRNVPELNVVSVIIALLKDGNKFCIGHQNPQNSPKYSPIPSPNVSPIYSPKYSPTLSPMYSPKYSEIIPSNPVDIQNYPCSWNSVASIQNELVFRCIFKPSEFISKFNSTSKKLPKMFYE